MVIRSAELVETLTWQGDMDFAGHSRAFHRAVAKERAAAGAEAPWAALGTRIGPAGPPIEEDPFVGFAILHPNVVAPMDGDGALLKAALEQAVEPLAVRFGRVLVDFDTAFGTATVKAFMADRTGHPSEVRALPPGEVPTGALATAFAVLQDRAPVAHNLVQAMTRRLVLRRTARADDPSFCWSTPLVIGAVNYGNVHLAPPHLLVENLVHESIHSLIYITQMADRMFEAEVDDHLEVTSPWTGALLHPRSFVHACFVWYGLSYLWTQTDCAAAFAGAAQERADLALSGFAPSPFNAAVGRVKEFLSPPWAEAVAALPDRVPTSPRSAT